MAPPLEPVSAAVRPLAERVDPFVAAVWDDHHEELYAFLVRTTRDPEAAADLLQDAFVRLVTETRAGRAPDNPRAWLYRVGANLACSRGRRLRSAVRYLATARQRSVTTIEEHPETGYLAAEARTELVRTLDELGPDARAALLLSSEGFSGTEIATAIGRSPTATRSLMTRARVRVRERLATTEIEP